MIKLIACDLDGTLLNNNGQLSDVTKDAICKVQEKGIEFMVATGRMYESVAPLFEECNLHCEYLLLNGALILDVDGTVLEESTMELVDVEACATILLEHDIAFHFYSTEGKVSLDSKRSMDTFIEHMRHSGMSEDAIQSMIEDTDFCDFDREIEDLLMYLKEKPSIYKMEAFEFDSNKLDIVRVALHNITNIAVTNSIKDNLEITHRNAQKGTALQLLCESKGMLDEEVLVFGDSYNDYNMLQTFPHSIAMKNGKQEIRDIATYVSEKTNDEDGVAEILYKLIAEK